MHCTRASIYTELLFNCLSFWVMQSAQPKLPRTHFQGHPWRGCEEGTPGVEALKIQTQICDVGHVESHTWD